MPQAEWSGVEVEEGEERPARNEQMMSNRHHRTTIGRLRLGLLARSDIIEENIDWQVANRKETGEKEGN